MNDTNRITLDRLAGDWWIYQLEAGHRYNTDDLLLAWTAWRARPEAQRLLDLGAGVGSVGLMTLLKMSAETTLLGVEVQKVSAELTRRSVLHNQLQDRVQVRCGDLRQRGVLRPDERFDLITANPPYLPIDSATASPHPQKAAARLELHGDVFDFCRVAAVHLEDEGLFCLCHAAGDKRPEMAFQRAGLCVLQRRQVVFRQGRNPVIALYVVGKSTGQQDHAPVLTLRSADGQRTNEFRSIRRDMLIEA